MRVKRFLVKPMDVEDAIAQMEMLGHNFFLFLNIDTESACVVYKRQDGGYGLLEPKTHKVPLQAYKILPDARAVLVAARVLRYNIR